METDCWSPLALPWLARGANGGIGITLVPDVQQASKLRRFQFLLRVHKPKAKLYDIIQLHVYYRVSFFPRPLGNRELWITITGTVNVVMRSRETARIMSVTRLCA